MKHFKILLLAFCTLSLTVQGQQKNSPAKMNASKIIRMSNSVIDLSNDAVQTISSYRSVVSTAEDNVTRLKSNPNQPPFFVNYKLYVPNQKKDAEYEQSSKLAPAFDEKAGLVSAMSSANADMAGMVKATEVLSNYFSNKEYQSDTDFSRYPALRDSVVSVIGRAYDSWRTASQLAAVAGDKAELLLLKDSRIAEFVIPMKTDLIALKAVLVKIGDQQSDLTLLSTDLETLKASVDKNKDISGKDIKKLSDLYYKEVYETFYRKCSQSVETSAKLVEILKGGEKDETRLSSFFNNARSVYSDAVDQYNTFVSQ